MPRVKGEGTQVSKMGYLGSRGDTGTAMAPLPHSQAATESPVLGAARPGTKPFLPAPATQRAAKGSSLLQNTPSLASHAPHCPQHWSCSCSHQSSWLESRRDITLLLGTSPCPSLTLLILWQRLLSLGGEEHIWLAVKAGEPGQHSEASSSTAWGCLDPCWGEQDTGSQL